MRNQGITVTEGVTDEGVKRRYRKTIPKNYNDTKTIHVFSLFIQIRRLLNFFSIPFAVNTMNAITYFLSVYLNTIKIPDQLQPTSMKRERYIVPDFQKISESRWSYWTILFAAIPALLTVILLFIESEITLLECFKVNVIALPPFLSSVKNRLFVDYQKISSFPSLASSMKPSPLKMQLKQQLRPSYDLKYVIVEKSTVLVTTITNSFMHKHKNNYSKTYIFTMAPTTISRFSIVKISLNHDSDDNHGQLYYFVQQPPQIEK